MFLNLTQRVSSKNPRKAYNDNSHLWYTNQPSGINKLGAAVKTMVTLSGLDVGARKISNTSIRKMVVSHLLRKNVSAKQIMAYTGHKSVTSLVNYDTMDHESGTRISNLLFQTNSTYERQSAPPVLIASPARQRTTNRAEAARERPSPSQQSTTSSNHLSEVAATPPSSTLSDPGSFNRTQDSRHTADTADTSTRSQDPRDGHSLTPRSQRTSKRKGVVISVSTPKRRRADSSTDSSSSMSLQSNEQDFLSRHLRDITGNSLLSRIRTLIGDKAVIHNINVTINWLKCL